MSKDTHMLLILSSTIIFTCCTLPYGHLIPFCLSVPVRDTTCCVCKIKTIWYIKAHVIYKFVNGVFFVRSYEESPIIANMP